MTGIANTVRATLMAAMLAMAASAQEAPTVARGTADEAPGEKIVIGEAEHFYIPLIDSTFRARIDTGAKTTSIFATEIEEFERDGEEWVRFNIRNDDTGESWPQEAKVTRIVPVKKRGQEGHHRRPAISMDLVMGEITRRLDVNLNDRTGFQYPLLIGRDFLGGLAVVDVTLAYTQETQGAPEEDGN